MIAVQSTDANAESVLPDDLRLTSRDQSSFPAIAKSPDAMARIRSALLELPTKHHLFLGDARQHKLEAESVHLVVTSPPYWTLKRYEDSEGQLGHFEEYEGFLDQLDQVWRNCYGALVPGGRLVCVVGDVCLSRRKNNGRHTVVPLHASIQERCRAIGFDNLAPIIWHKIANAVYEAEGTGGGFLGKPYEPNGVVKNDIEFVLMQRKPGGYRSPSPATRVLSLISEADHRAWFQQIWTGVTGASTRKHPAPYPVELAERLVRMFSFAGDVVYDPFMGSGTTSIAAMRNGRNSLGCEVQPGYYRLSLDRLHQERDLFSVAEVVGDQ
jgi:modification methylase